MKAQLVPELIQVKQGLQVLLLPAVSALWFVELDSPCAIQVTVVIREWPSQLSSVAWTCGIRTVSAPTRGELGASDVWSPVYSVGL
ncbi:MAG TPA: hypothetical protein VEI50_10425 [Nitrospiraceae bacterium]|nr:hypothetical protein [Nitrospiraceae bacterium]